MLETYPANLIMPDGVRAKNARLVRRVKRAASKFICAKAFQCIANSFDFRMSGNVVVGACGFDAFADNDAVTHDDCADRRIPGPPSF